MRAPAPGYGRPVMRPTPSRTSPPTSSPRTRRALTAAALGVVATGALAVPASASDTVVLGAAKTKAPVHAQIVGGTPITTEAAPHQVFVGIETAGGDEYACGGSIIDATHVLTAAHCTFDDNDLPIDLPLATYTVVAGVADVKNGPGPGETAQVKDATAVNRHPGYTNALGGNDSIEEFSDDAAVLTLASP